MKRAVVIAAAVIVVGTAAGLLLYPKRTTEVTAITDLCRICGSYRHTVTTTANGAEVVPSCSSFELLEDDHRHDWAFYYSDWESRRGSTVETKHVNGWPGRTGRLPNRFTATYNESPRFRALVRKRMEAGDLSRSLVGRIVLLDGLDGTSEAASRATALLREFESK